MDWMFRGGCCGTMDGEGESRPSRSERLFDRMWFLDL